MSEEQQAKAIELLRMALVHCPLRRLGYENAPLDVGDEIEKLLSDLKEGNTDAEKKETK